MSGRKRKRLRAHANPLSDFDFAHPMSPSSFDWSQHYPDFAEELAEGKKKVTIADVGCGFGGLLVALSPEFPDDLILGLEIRGRVVEIDKERIQKLRADGEKKALTAGAKKPYSNISVLQTNIMKYSVNYFEKGQLRKMFILFADPHFKKANHRRRVINQAFLAQYAYIMAIGGLLYMITDVKDLYDWNVRHLEAHPLFERLTEEEYADDPCVDIMSNKTEEGMKVTRNGGSKWFAIYRRIDRKTK